MATAFPGALDSFTSPTTADYLNSPSHVTQHVNTNGACTALETKLGTGASTPVAGTILVGTGTGTSAWDESVAIIQTTTTGYGLSVSRDLAAASTNGALVYLNNDNAGDDRPALYIKDDGDGSAQGGSLFLWHTNTSGRGIYVDYRGTTGTAYAGQSGIAVTADYLNEGAAFYGYSNSATFSNTGGGLIESFVDNTSATGNAICAHNDGTGNGVFIDQNGAGLGLYIDNDGGATGIRLDGCTGTSTKAPQTDACTGFIKVNIDGTDRYIPYYAAS